MEKSQHSRPVWTEESFKWAKINHSEDRRNQRQRDPAPITGANKYQGKNRFNTILNYFIYL